MSTDNSNTTDRLSGVSVRVNGQTYGAEKQGPDFVPNGQPVRATVHGTANQVNAYVPFDEQNVGDLDSVTPFADSYEMQAAFRDPRYKTSAAFRLEVGRRSLAMRRAQQG